MICSDKISVHMSNVEGTDSKRKEVADKKMESYRGVLVEGREEAEEREQ